MSTVLLYLVKTPPSASKKASARNLCKRGDYSEAYLRNTDLAGLEHISLKIIPLKKHYSSSNLIEKIVSAYRKETQ